MNLIKVGLFFFLTEVKNGNKIVAEFFFILRPSAYDANYTFKSVSNEFFFFKPVENAGVRDDSKR